MNPTEHSEIAQVINALAIPSRQGAYIPAHELVCELSRLFYSWDKLFAPLEFMEACENQPTSIGGKFDKKFGSW